MNIFISIQVAQEQVKGVGQGACTFFLMPSWSKHRLQRSLHHLWLCSRLPQIPHLYGSIFGTSVWKKWNILTSESCIRYEILLNKTSPKNRCIDALPTARSLKPCNLFRIFLIILWLDSDAAALNLELCIWWWHASTVHQNGQVQLKQARSQDDTLSLHSSLS